MGHHWTYTPNRRHVDALMTTDVVVAPEDIDYTPLSQQYLAQW
jgi:hypothetical protein